MLPVFNILLSLLELLSKLDTGVSKDNALEVDNLTLLQLHVDDRLSVPNNNDLTLFVLLLNCQSRFGNSFLAGVDSSCQSNDAVLFSKVHGHLE